MKKNFGLIITVVLIVSVLAATLGVAIFAGVVAATTPLGGSGNEVEQTQGNEGGNNGDVENLGGETAGAENGGNGGNNETASNGGNADNGGNGEVENSTTESVYIADEMENTEKVTGFPEMPGEE